MAAPSLKRDLPHGLTPYIGRYTGYFFSLGKTVAPWGITVTFGFGVAVAVGVISGVFQKRWSLLRQETQPEMVGVPPASTTFAGRLGSAANHAAKDFFDMGRFLLLGSIVAALIQTFLSRPHLAALGGRAITSVPLMMALAFLLSLCSEADAFVFVLQDIPLYKYGISLNKLYDYLAAMRPILLAGNPVNNDVQDADCGLTVPPGDPRALAEALVRLADMPEDVRRTMAQRGRTYVEQHHDHAVLAERLRRCIEELG